jgi:hypothetical protein
MAMPRLLAVRTIVLCAALGLLPACAGLPVVNRTVIAASQTAQDCRSRSDWSTAGYCGSSHIPGGTCRAGLRPGQILDLKGEPPQVGFSHRSNPGTPPLSCWAWVSTVSRAYVNFDVAPVLGRNIAEAKLAWDPTSERKEAGMASSLPLDSPPHCVKRLFEATTPWKALDTPGKLLSDELDTTQLDKGIVVTEVVKRWAQAGGGQFGLFFTASDETLHPKIDKMCETTLFNLRLEVTYQD